MYLHLGQDVVVRSRDIVGIFDIENTSVSKITKEYLTNQEKNTGSSTFLLNCQNHLLCAVKEKKKKRLLRFIFLRYPVLP